MTKKLSAVLFAAAALAVLLIAGASAQADMVIGLTADDANSSPPRIAGTVSSVLDDVFAYDISNPTSATPNTNYAEDGVALTANGYHGNNSVPAPIIALDVTSPYTVVANDILVLDAWGRSGGNAARQARDDNYTVELFSGGSAVATLTGQTIDGTFFNRTTISGLAAGTVIDEVQLTGDNAQFTIQEVRFGSIAVAIPEPSSMFAFALAGIAGATRRRRS